MKNLKIICDSLSDIPKELIEKYDIEVIPLSVILNETEYVDGIDITKEEFYKMLRENENLPTTSQVTYMGFKNVFDKYINQGMEILYIGGSSNASGTYQSAVMAKNDIDSGIINTFDTMSLSIGSGLMVITAARLKEEGKTSKEIMDYLEKIKENISVLFTVETLEYLKKGGRISLAKATIGSMLNIKPVLCLNDGLVKPISQARGKKQVINNIIELIKEQHGSDLLNKQILIGCGDNTSDLNTLRKRLEEEFLNVECIEVSIGSCICAHSGPAVLGIACCDK